MLLVVLSVLSYTPTCHALTVKDLERVFFCEQSREQEGASPEEARMACDHLTPQEGGPTDFTLGVEQKVEPFSLLSCLPLSKLKVPRQALPSTQVGSREYGESGGR